MVNPRYARYAEAQGYTPEEMLKADKDKWPGGCMCGFILWMAEQWRAFCEIHDVLNTTELRLKLGYKETDDQFDAWQRERV